MAARRQRVHGEDHGPSRQAALTGGQPPRPPQEPPAAPRRRLNGPGRQAVLMVNESRRRTQSSLHALVFLAKVYCAVHKNPLDRLHAEGCMTVTPNLVRCNI